MFDVPLKEGEIWWFLCDCFPFGLFLLDWRGNDLGLFLGYECMKSLWYFSGDTLVAACLVDVVSVGCQMDDIFIPVKVLFDQGWPVFLAFFWGDDIWVEDFWCFL